MKRVDTCQQENCKFLENLAGRQNSHTSSSISAFSRVSYVVQRQRRGVHKQQPRATRQGFRAATDLIALRFRLKKGDHEQDQEHEQEYLRADGTDRRLRIPERYADGRAG